MCSACAFFLDGGGGVGVLLDLMPDIGLGWVGSRGWWGREEHHTHEVLKQRFWLSAYLKYLGAVG